MPYNKHYINVIIVAIGAYTFIVVGRIFLKIFWKQWQIQLLVLWNTKLCKIQKLKAKAEVNRK